CINVVVVADGVIAGLFIDAHADVPRAASPSSAAETIDCVVLFMAPVFHWPAVEHELQAERDGMDWKPVGGGGWGLRGEAPSPRRCPPAACRASPSAVGTRRAKTRARGTRQTRRVTLHPSSGPG